MKQEKETAGKAEIGISGVILEGGANKRFNGLTKSTIVIDGNKIISRITDTIKDIFDEISKAFTNINTPDDISIFINFISVKKSKHYEENIILYPCDRAFIFSL